MDNGVRNPRRRTRRSRRVPANLQSELRKQHGLDYRGIVARGRTDPPRVLFTPWNNLTLTFTYTNSTSAAVNKCFDFFTDIKNAFAGQSGLSTTAIDIGVRIMSAQFWHIATEAPINNVVRARFYSLIEGINTCGITDTLAQIQDYGDKMRNATAKFVWPRTHSSNTYPISSTRIWSRITTGIGQTILCHVQVLWKFNGSTSISQASGPMTEELLFNQEQNVDDLRQLELI